MRKVISLIAVCFILGSLVTVNGNTPPEKAPYCGELMDGRFVVMHENNILAGTATLSDGTTVKPDGTLTRKDGTVSKLKEGECIGENGIIAGGLKPREKTETEQKAKE